MVKNPLAMQKTQVQSLRWEDPLEKGMATHSSILAWRIQWTKEPWQATIHRMQTVGRNWEANTHTHCLRTDLSKPQEQPMCRSLHQKMDFSSTLKKKLHGSSATPASMLFLQCARYTPAYSLTFPSRMFLPWITTWLCSMALCIFAHFSIRPGLTPLFKPDPILSLLDSPLACSDIW